MKKKKVSAREYRRRKNQSEQGDVSYKFTPDGWVKFTKLKKSNGYKMEYLEEEQC